MKYLTIIILFISSLCYGQSWVTVVPSKEFTTLEYPVSSFGHRPAGHHLPATDTTIVLNKGKANCSHDWVEQKPMSYSTMSNAVYINPDSDKSWEKLRICKHCLRHEQINYFSKWVLNKDEYGELLKKIKP